MTTTTTKTRPAPKTGDPAADKAAKMSSHHKNLSYPSRAEKLAAHLVNDLHLKPADLDDHTALVLLHGEHCQDKVTDAPKTEAVKRVEARGSDQEAVAEAEGDFGPGGTFAEKDFEPVEKQAKEKPQPVKRTAKQALARLMLKAMDEAIAKLNDENLADAEHGDILAGLSRAECERTVSQWIHHLPVGDEWTATHIPVPQRSDWEAKTAKKTANGSASA